MIRRPPRSTRTDTLFPYTTLFRSSWWSEQMYCIYGLSPAATQHNRAVHLALYTPESRQRLEAALEKSRDTGAPYELALAFVTTLAAHRWVAARAEGLGAEGGWTRLAGVVIGRASWWERGGHDG